MHLKLEAIRTPGRLILLFVLLVMCLTHCQATTPQPAYEPKWVYTDLRILDEVDAPTPEQDLLAGYLRLRGTELQIRLDFLDLTELPASDLYLAIDSAGGGASELPWHQPVDLAWDALVVIPASGDLQVLGTDLHPINGSGLRIIRDPIQDTLIISLFADSLPGGGLPARLQAYSTPPESTTIGDELGVFQSDGLPPEPAAVLLAFWDTLPAYTPALGLRRWDGAHTGPLGGRHGLYDLLRTARARQIPLALLDLKTPASLSALDYVDGLPLVHGMLARGELILPEVLPGFIPNPSDIAPTWLQASGWDQAGLTDLKGASELAFGLPAGPFTYSPGGLPASLSPSSRFVFTFNNQLREPQLTRWQQQTVLELPTDLPSGVATINGPDAVMRQAMIQAAITANTNGEPGLVVIGGDLPDSAWGNPEIARATFSYLVAHPWVRLMDGYGLLGLPNPETPATKALVIQPGDPPAWIESLAEVPESNLKQAAWQAFASLYAPVYPHPAQLPAVREAYLGIVPALATAAGWAAAPAPIQDCSRDIDLDGQPECLFASRHLLAVIQPENGELTFAFAIDGDGPHQLVGPGYQLISGLSEPESWDLRASFESDPGAGSGAFRDPPGTGVGRPQYTRRESPNELVFTAQDGSVQKTYKIIDDRLQVILEPTQATRYEIPLAFDPWLRFSADWSQLFAATAYPDGWLWGLEGGAGVSVESNADMQMDSVLDSLASVGQPEDPNQEHPAGHWLPFPTARLTLLGQGRIILTIGLHEATPQGEP